MPEMPIAVAAVVVVVVVASLEAVGVSVLRKYAAIENLQDKIEKKRLFLVYLGIHCQSQIKLQCN